MGLCYYVIALGMLKDMKGKQKWISNVSLNDRVFCFLFWLNALIDRVQRETIPKEGATWQIRSNLMIEFFVFYFG